MAARPDRPFAFVRAGIGRALRTLFSNISSEAIPDGMAELLKRLDQPVAESQDIGETDHRKKVCSGFIESNK
jgi:hypothetical protein